MMDSEQEKSGCKTEHYESVVYAAMWLIVLVMPFINELLRVSFQYEFSWANILRWCIGAISFIAVFFIHNYFLVPRYLLRGRSKTYITTILLTVALFVTFQYVTFDRRKALYKPKVEKYEQIKQPEINSQLHFPTRLQNRFFGVPLPIMLNLMILLLMLGTNLAVIFVFKYLREREMRKAVENARLQSEISFLKAQINPHFFMNMMNNIHAMIELDPEMAQAMTIELSQLMRYMLYEADTNAVPLANEIAFVSNYIAVLQRRFPADKVRVTFEASDSLGGKFMVPPLLFISFVENAFKHGVSYQKLSEINISFEEKDGMLQFQCSNTLPSSMSIRKDIGGVGLENASRRLYLLYGSGYDLKISNENGFYKVNLIIPSL